MTKKTATTLAETALTHLRQGRGLELLLTEDQFQVILALAPEWGVEISLTSRGGNIAAGTAVIVVAAAGAVGATAVMVALRLFGLTLGPVGWIALGVGALVGASVATSAVRYDLRVRRLDRRQVELVAVRG